MSITEEIRAAERIETNAWIDLVEALPRDLAEAIGARVETIDEATVVAAPGLPSPMFNRALGLGVATETTDSTITRVLGAFDRAGSKTFWVHVGNATRPGDVADRLVARGASLATRRAWAKVLRGTEPPPALRTAFAIRPLEAAERETFANALCTAHSLPPALAPWLARLADRPRWRAYGAFDGTRLVGGGLLFVDGTDAWLGLGGTLPEVRGRGAQHGVMVARIEDALSQGCLTLATETGEPIGDERNASLDNMFRTGFHRVTSRSNYEFRRQNP